MLDPIRRENHIVTGEREDMQAGTPGMTTIEAVRAVETGNEIASMWFADGAGGGDGTQGNETTLGAAVPGAGAGGLVVAFGGSGDLAGNVTLANDQILLGGASTLQIQGLTTSTMATYAPGGARPTILDDGTAATAVVQLADGNLLAGFDTTSDGINILGNGVDDLIVRQVGTGGLGSGMAVIGGTNIDVTDFAYRRSAPTSGGFGLELMNVMNGTLDGLQIENAGSGVFIANSQGVGIANLNSANSAVAFNIVSSNDVEVTQVAASYTLVPPVGIPHAGVVRDSTNVKVDGLIASNQAIGLLITSSADVDAGNINVTNAGTLGIQIQNSTNVLLHDFTVTNGAGTGLQIIDSTSTGRVITVNNGALSNVGSGGSGAVMLSNVTGDVTMGNTGVTLSNLAIAGAQGLSTALAKGVFLSAAHGVTLQNISIDGRNAMGVAVTNNALELGGSTGITASGLQISNILGNGIMAQNFSSVSVEDFTIQNTGGTGIFVNGGTGAMFSQGSITDSVASSTAVGAGGIFVRAQSVAPTTQATFLDITIKGAASTTPGSAQAVGIFNSLAGATINASFTNVAVDAASTGGATVTATGFNAFATTGTVTISGMGNTSDAATDCSITGAGGSIEIDGVVHSDASC